MQSRRIVILASPDGEVVETIRPLLEQLGYSCILLDKGSRVVLEMLARNVELIILDLELDGMSGIEIIPIIKELRPKLPLMVISNDDSFETGKEVAKFGVWYFVMKPVDSSLIYNLITYLPYRASSGLN
jgi:DNA-binding NtrC family response regulator